MDPADGFISFVRVVVSYRNLDCVSSERVTIYLKKEEEDEMKINRIEKSSFEP